MDEIELKDIIQIIWKRKWFIILIPLAAVIISIIVINIKGPTYIASSKIALGTFNNDLYTKPLSAQQLILSRNTLDLLSSKLNLMIEDIEVTPVKNTNVIQITAKNKDPEVARKIVEEVSNDFIKKSNLIYQDQYNQMRQLITLSENQYNQVSKSLERYKSTLQTVEESNLNQSEKNQESYRLTTYIINDQNELNDLSKVILDTTTKLTNIRDTTIIEKPSESATTIQKTISIIGAIAVAGIMISIVLVFFLEYLADHPIRLNEDKNSRINNDSV